MKLLSLIMLKGLSILIVLLLSGCGRHAAPATPALVADVSTPKATVLVTVTAETPAPPTSTPVVTPTASPTKTPTTRPTATQTSVPSEELRRPPLPPVTETPKNSAELYRLRAWSDVEAFDLVARMTSYAEGIKADWTLYTYYGDQGRHETIAAGYEFILRYPYSAYRPDVEWQMVDASTHLWEESLDEMMAKLIEAALNTGDTTLEALDAYLQTHGFQIRRHDPDCQECTPFPTAIPNLLGDGREIPLFLIERLASPYEGEVLMAVWQETDERFVVVPIISKWAAMSRFSGGISNFEARDITGGSQPTLLVKLWGHSGSIIQSSLYMFQWGGESFAQLAGTPFNFSGGPFADEWHFVDGDAPSRLQVTRGYDGITSIYEWMGNRYEMVEVNIEDVPPDPTNVYSASEWIQRGIESDNYPTIVAYLEDAVQKPASEYRPSGVEYHRAMRFVLGMNYVYLEEEEKARFVFEGLRDEGSPAELAGFSQAARVFLEYYDGLGNAYVACRMAYDAMLATESGPPVIVELMPLCAFDKLFVERLRQYDGLGSIFDYLDEAEIIYGQQQDLNGDGRLDWLLALSHPTLFSQSGVEIWAVLLTDGGTEAIKLTTLLPRREEKVEEISVGIYSALPFDTPLIAVLGNNNFRLLQLVKDEEDVWESKAYLSNGITLAYDLQLVENDFQLDLSIDPNVSYWDFDRVIYRWDTEIETFVEVSRYAANSLGIPFSEALTLAETLILENGDYSAAIPILIAIAREYEPQDDGEWYSLLPKTLYLLGLAHELQGNQMQAVAAYWQLWYEYPTATYALMAAAKLEEK